MVVFAALILAWLGTALFAGPGHDHDHLKNFDRRQNAKSKGPARPSAEQEAAVRELKKRIPDAEVDFDPVLGSPKWIQAKRGFLSGPTGEGGAVRAQTARGFGPKDRDRPVKALLQEHRRLFGHGPEVLETARRTRDYVTVHNQMRTVVWKQQLDGIPVFGAVLIANLTSEDELVNLSSQFVPEAEKAANAGVPKRRALQKRPGLSAREALLIAIENVGESVAPEQVIELRGPLEGPEQRHEFQAGDLPGEAHASLVWLPEERGRMRLCWEVEVTRRERGERFRVLVDAVDGTVQVRHGLTFDLSEVTYRVFTSDSPSPFTPGHDSPSRAQPPMVPRSLVTLSALNTNASPLGWIHPGVHETRGNNVDAYLDRDGDNRPDLPRPVAAPGKVFDFPLDLEDSPVHYGEAAVVQLFYWCNWVHDRLYELGFTEAAGNFQKDNFGRGGLGGDPMLAEAQDGSGFNNANYTAARDGTSPRIQMFIFNGADPWRDSAFDAEVIIHEYVHGLTDRMVGGGVGLSGGDQTFGLAEGWSDFYALALLSESSDDVDGTYAYGGYMAHRFAGLHENYYFGIRRYPYTTDMSKNPLTFAHTYADDVAQHPHIPRNPIITSTGKAVHRMGEVWCSMLWEARANLIRKHGFEVGNELILKLVTDGLKHSPPNPNFIQARDGIFTADRISHGAANHFELWRAFAKRGLGYSARTSDHWLSGGWASEAFDLPGGFEILPPGELVVQSLAGAVMNGPEGGPLEPASLSYLVLNPGLSDVRWTAQPGTNWLTVAPAEAWVDAAGSTTLTLSPTAAAEALPVGVYTNALFLTNQLTGTVITRNVVLRVSQKNWLAETFAAGEFDLAQSSLTFTPKESGNSYTICRMPALEFPTDPAGGAFLMLPDDAYAPVTLADGAEISLFGTSSNSFFIGSNGDLVFEPAAVFTYDDNLGMYTNYFSPGPATFFERLRFGPLYSDLNPAAGGAVSWKQLPDRVAVTFEDVPEYGTTNRNSFQAELFFDGVIRFTYLMVELTIPLFAGSDIIVGLSEGVGADGFFGNDLSVSPRCHPGVQLVLPASATEGDPPFEGTVVLEKPAESELAVAFLASPSGILQIEDLTIPPGATSATFQVSVPDDNLLNGTRRVEVTAFIREPSSDGEPPSLGGVDPVSPGSTFPPESGSATIEIFDNEIATLNIAVPPSVMERQGVLQRAGAVSIQPAPDTAVRIELFSSHPEVVRVPAEAIIPAGATWAPFDLNILEAKEFTPVTAVSILAFVRNWESTSAAMDVLDNKSRQLSLFLPALISEQSGTISNAGRIEIAGLLETNLPVRLASGSPGRLPVPATLILPAGQRVVHFDLTPVDDNEITGPQTVVVTASAPGFTEMEATVVIEDDESPLPAILPSPAHGSTNLPTGIELSWSQERGHAPEGTFFEIYAGTNSVPGPAEFLGTTAHPAWELPALDFGETYYWQVVAGRGAVRIPGPVWQFTTMDLYAFEVTLGDGPYLVGVPFDVTVRAIHEDWETATTFRGPVRLSAPLPAPADASIVIAEVDTGSPPKVEFANVSGRDLEITGWEISLYDWVSWPEPRTVFTIPERNLCPAGDVFVLRRSSAQAFPGEYPNFGTGTNLSWNNIFIGNPVAVLLRDAEGNIVDFMCAVDADPSEITVPLTIPPEQWEGSPVEGKRSSEQSYHRIGAMDRNHASDWQIGTTNIGVLNTNLTVPFFANRPALLTPETLDNFNQGVWTGQVTVAEPAEGIALRVEDGRGYSGSGSVFSVGVPDDLSLALQSSGSIPRVGSFFTYTLIVSNSGPSTATGVSLTTQFEGPVVIHSAEATHGSCVIVAGRVVCSMGNLEGEEAAMVTIQLIPRGVGELRCFAEVTRAEPEAYLANNSASAVTPLDYPWLSIANVRITEGHTGTTNAVFPVLLSVPVSETVTVNFHTSDGTATAGLDYVATNGTLVFPPGTTELSIPVAVLGDTLNEGNEIFFVHLAEPVNAVIGASPAIGTIVDDDFFGGVSVRISDASVVEGDEGVTEAVFHVTLSAAAERVVTIPYETSDGTATAGLDYIATYGRLTFPVGVTNQTITVEVLGDRLFETNETFFVKLGFTSAASIARSQGVGTIVDDDSEQLQRFVWSPFGTEQKVNAPFSAGLTALDGAGRPVTNFNGTIVLRAGRDAQEVSIGNLNNLWHHPFSASFQDARLQALYLPSELGRAGRIRALSLNLSSLPGQVLSNWTIRMKHSRRAYSDESGWEESGWTVVYQSDETLVSPGWTTFVLETPFHYNGADHLLVDFSFSNSHSSTDGMVQSSAAPTNEFRSLTFRTDGAFGSPLEWGANTPPPVRTNRFPNVRFSMDTPVPVTPGISGSFVNGSWAGQINLLDRGSNVLLLARDSEGRSGVSSPFQVAYIDTDGDGIPDEWERMHGMNPNDPSDAFLDFDQDGMTNWEEFMAGTDPRDPGSVLRITALEIEGGMLRVIFPSVEGKRYEIEAAAGGSEWQWMPLSGVILGTGEPYSFAVPIEGDGYEFYRIKLVLP